MVRWPSTRMNEIILSSLSPGPLRCCLLPSSGWCSAISGESRVDRLLLSGTTNRLMWCAKGLTLTCCVRPRPRTWPHVGVLKDQGRPAGRPRPTPNHAAPALSAYACASSALIRDPSREATGCCHGPRPMMMSLCTSWSALSPRHWPGPRLRIAAPASVTLFRRSAGAEKAS